MNNTIQWCIIIFTVFFIPICTEIRGEGNRDDVVGDADYIAIFWTEGDHAEYLEELSDYYTMETEVFVFVDTVPRSDYRAIAFNELAAHSEAFDIIVGEPEWLGEGVMRGHYVELTEWVMYRGRELVGRTGGTSLRTLGRRRGFLRHTDMSLEYL
jgi:hypothetical protein